MVSTAYLNPIVALFKLVRIPLSTILIPLGGLGMPSGFEKIQNLVWVPPFDFGAIPEPPRGSFLVIKGPPLKK